MKRILSVFLTLALIAGFFPLTKASAAEVNDLKPTSTPTPSPAVTPSAADFKFDSSTGTITGYVGNGGNVNIPSIINGVSVTSIGDEAFDDCSGLTSITIPNSVTSIGDYAFGWCSGLTSITIPSSVTSIAFSAFWYCSSLTSITIPGSVTSIGDYAFSGCSKLTAINVDATNKNYSSINGALFDKNQTTLLQYPIGVIATSYNIPNSVTSIGENAFYGCSDLTSITIPRSVTSIGDYAFGWCSGLTSITIPGSVTSIGRYTFIGSGLTSITIPDSVTSIGEDAFSDCSGLTSITIPSSVTSIGEAAFEGCNKLTAINVDATNENYSSINGALFDKNQTTLLQYPKGIIATSYNIPNSVTSIGDYAFSGCSDLTSITIPSSVTSIGEYAFGWCSGLTSITIPGNVTSIAFCAFCGCNKLTSITIPSSVTSIGNYAFSSCSGLTSITIPGSVTSIGEYAFSSCSGLTSITIPSSVTSIGNYAFSSCSGLTSITIPGSVTSIGKGTFYYCSGLASITIPSSVTSIGEDAFSGCSGLTIYTTPGSAADTYAKSHSIPVNYLSPTPAPNSVTPSTVTYDARKLPAFSVKITTYNSLTDVKNGTTALVAGKDYIVSGSALSIAPGYFNYYFNKFPNQDLKLTLYFSAGNTAELTVHPFWEQIPVITPSEVKIDKTKISDVSVTMEVYGNTLTSINNGTAALNPLYDYSISGNAVTIKKSYINYYFSKFPNQNLNIIFKFSDGYDRILTLYTGNSPNTDITPTVVTYKVGSKTDVTVTAIMNGNFFSSINNGTSQLVPRVDYTYAADTNTLILRSSYMAYYFNKFNQDLMLTVNFTGGKPVTLTIKPQYN